MRVGAGRTRFASVLAGGMLAIAVVGGVGGPAGRSGADAATDYVWAFGDLARCPDGGPANDATRNVVAGDDAPLLLLGDLVSPSGSTAEFTTCFDPVWGSLKSRMKPVPGNHEYNTQGAAGYFAYFDQIPRYYAWEFNGWRLYALNSMCGYTGGCSSADPQYRWLEDQLRTHAGACQVAYWHHPRWSQGGHGNVAKMAPVYDLLVRYGVELLLVGHENGVYERYPALDAAGRPSAVGVTEFVVSTGGVDDGAGEVVLNEPTPVARADGTMGALRLRMNESSWQAEFVPEAGKSYTDAASGTCFDESTPPPSTTTTTTTTPPSTSTTTTTTTTTTSTTTTTTTPPSTSVVGGDTTSPTSTISAPRRGTRISSPVSFSGSASDDRAVQAVRVAVRDQSTRHWLQPDGTWAAEYAQVNATLQSPGASSTTWSLTRALPTGQYGVSVRAVDAASNTQTPDTWVVFDVG